MLGERFEKEIREQPAVWRSIARSTHAADLAAALKGRAVVLVGSGSSLFSAQLGALALRRRAIDAAALAATEARFDSAAYRRRVVVALSQSGRSADILGALDHLEPATLVALTNEPESPLGRRADLTIPVDAGPERAVPASKSVTASVAILLWSAGLLSGASARDAAALARTADDVERWLEGAGPAEVAGAAERLARSRSIMIVGAGYGVPVAYESALKMKEASYLHAEGFAAGEFRHGSSAMLDASRAIVGIVDDASRDIVRRPLAEAARAEALRYTIGGAEDGIALLGPAAGDPFNTLAWLVTGQMLALSVGRARGVDSDAPRGLHKFLA